MALKEPPLFYHGLNEIGAQTMTDISKEICEIASAIMKQRPEVSRFESYFTSPYTSGHCWGVNCKFRFHFGKHRNMSVKPLDVL